MSTNPKKGLHKRKAILSQPSSNQLTHYFSTKTRKPQQNGENETKENFEVDFKILKKPKRVKPHEPNLPSQQENSSKITIFLKKDPNTSNISIHTNEEYSPSKISTNNMKSKVSEKKMRINGSQRILRLNKSPKKKATPNPPKQNFLSLYRQIDCIFKPEDFDILKKMMNKINESLKKRFNIKKVERIFLITLKQFLRSSPDQLWSAIYRPNHSNELLSDKYANLVKFWLQQFFRNQRKDVSQIKGNSESFSESEDTSSRKGFLDLEKNFVDSRFTNEEQKEIFRTMKYKSLLIIGKEGRGKLSLVQSVCNDINLEPIEICNSSNRSSIYLDEIYEATQSQNIFMKADIQEPKNQINEESLLQAGTSKASVIIVRDFDKPLEIDKGFQNKILKLSETSKSPFILLCEQIPKDLTKFHKIDPKGLISKADPLFLNKFSIEDIALLFYIILNIEKNFSKVFKDFRYKIQETTQKLSETFKDDLTTLFHNEHRQPEILSCFEDILEVTKYFEGNLTRLFALFEFHKTLIFEQKIDEFKKECFLANEARYRKVNQDLLKFQKDQFSKQLLDTYRGNKKIPILHFSCSLQHLSEINELTKALDFFSEPMKEIQVENRKRNTEIIQISEFEKLSGATEFLDRMCVLDMLETNILNNKFKNHFNCLEHSCVVNGLTKGAPSTGDISKNTASLNEKRVWNRFEIQEKIYLEIQEHLLNQIYLSSLFHNQKQAFVYISPYDDDIITKMIVNLKKDLCKIISNLTSCNEKDMKSLNELIIAFGNSLYIKHKNEDWDKQLNDERSDKKPEEKGKIEANIYVKSMLSHELKSLRREIRFKEGSNREINNGNIFATFDKESELDEIIKIIMTFSCSFFNKNEFSEFHTKILREGR